MDRHRHDALPQQRLFLNREALINSVTLIISSLMLCLLIVNVFWWAGMRITIVPLVVGIALGLSYQIYGFRRGLPATLVASCGIGLLSAISFLVFSALWDPSHDGPWYQAPAVVNIVSGWNPLTQDTSNEWVNRYTTGLWALRAVMTRVYGGNLSGGRTIFVLTEVPLAILCYLFYRSTLPSLSHRLCVIITGLTICNPVSVGQWMTDYVDNYVAIFAASMIFVVFNKSLLPHVRWVLLTSFSVLIIATKISGVYYVVIIVGAQAVTNLVRSLKDDTFGSDFVGRQALAYLPLMVLGAVVAYRPFIKSLIEHGVLIYPPIDQSIRQLQTPQNLWDASSFLKAAYLVFGEGSGFESKHASDLDLTLAVKASQFHIYPWDARSVAFGPFFKYQFIASFIVLCILVISRCRVSPELYRAAAVCMVATMLFPESWCGRYVPLVWTGSVMLLAPTLDRNTFRRSCLRGTSAIRGKKSEHDATEQPVPTLRRHALARVDVRRWVSVILALIAVLLPIADIAVVGANAGLLTYRYNRRFNEAIDRIGRDTPLTIQAREEGTWKVSLAYELTHLGYTISPNSSCTGTTEITDFGSYQIC